MLFKLADTLRFRKLVFKILLVIAMFFAFTALYKLLEKKSIYYPTLGKITLNYEKTDSNGHSFIRETNKPFSNFIEKDACNWDVEYYRDIRDNMYKGHGIGLIYRYAFYPLFPLVWKLSHTNVHGIVFLNYLMFGLGLILLSSLFLKNSKSEMFLFMLALLLPTSVVYYLPYTESLFLLTFSIALVGLVKKKYWLFYLAMTCFSMTRPAAFFLVAVFTIANAISFISHKQFSRFLKECFLTILPILTGWALVMLIEYHYSGIWTNYIVASNLWPKDANLYKDIVDWSLEGFGMTAFAIFFLAIPASIYVVFWGNTAILGKEKNSTSYLFGGDEEYIKKYLFNASMLFMMGFALFYTLVNGYQLNGFYRYTMATPFFFIILFQLPEKLKSIPIPYKATGFIVLLVCILLFLLSSPYAGNIGRFNYLGLYLLIPLTMLVIAEPYLNNRIKFVLLAILILPCLIWHTFLFNMYLGDTWIFT
jgi:hypothetical protein